MGAAGRANPDWVPSAIPGRVIPGTVPPVSGCGGRVSPVGAPPGGRAMGAPGWVMGRAMGCGAGRGAPAIGAGPAGRGTPAGPGIGWGTPAVGAVRVPPAGEKAPVAAGRGACEAIGWLGRGTVGWDVVGTGAAATAGRGGIIG